MGADNQAARSCAHGCRPGGVTRVPVRGDFRLICVGDPRQWLGSVVFLVVWPHPGHVPGGGGPQSGSRWSARSAARTNDLEADEDPPQTVGRPGRGKDVAVQVMCCLPGENALRETTSGVPAPSLTCVKSDGESGDS